MSSTLFLLLVSTISLLSFPGCDGFKQADRLREFLMSQKSAKSQWAAAVASDAGMSAAVHILEQDGMMERDKITELPGQPEGVDFDQYAGYVTVDPKTGRALFYYFVESSDPSNKPLVLWLNGGPGCSSLGAGAMMELGPFRVKSDGKTLYRNDYAWNKLANIIFLESPVGVGFSYSNTTDDYKHNGENRTADDSYTFLVNWLERFPQYKNRDFYIAGESYAGHYVPDLAYVITLNNKNKSRSFINLKGISIGNAFLDSPTNDRGNYDYLWSHAMISDETHNKMAAHCSDYAIANRSDQCWEAIDICNQELGTYDGYSIYYPLCTNKTIPSNSVLDFDPCSENYIISYLNLPEVQKALHANITKIPHPWAMCLDVHWDWASSDHSMLPKLKSLSAEGLRLWLYSGDLDSVVSVRSTQNAIEQLALPIEEPWRPWYTDVEEKKQLGGHAMRYKGLVFATVRGAGHEVPSFQPLRALMLFSSFLQGKLP